MSRPRKAKSFLKENSLTILTVIGVCTGSAVGLILKHSTSGEWSKRDIMYIAFPGECFLRYERIPTAKISQIEIKKCA